MSSVHDASPRPALAGSELLLRRLAGPEASFRVHQREAIEDLVVGRRRVLCVQRTGWGKSAVYFIATALQRAAEHGPTLLVSPLLALMRNQLEAARRLGIRAATVNSSNREQWEAVRGRLQRDEIDLLLISPERLSNLEFREQVLPLFVERVGLLVIDEAHCVSDWGHDFRPDYRRLRGVMGDLRPGTPVLCTTATANDRVVGDVREQLAAGTDDAALTTYRGPLGRASLRLEVVDLPRQAHRLAWLACWMPALSGSGIVYCLTRRDTETVADWLNAHDVAALAYSGETDDARRLEVEDKLLGNEVKAVVATSALGMGYDKPDLGFVVHYQAPGSVIAYYQQVGRAGRALPDADAVLLRGAEDRDIQDFFIESAFPSFEHAHAIVEHIAAAQRPVRLTELLGVVNVGRAKVEAMLKILDVEGALDKLPGGYVRTAEPWSYDAERYQQVTALRRAEQRQMARYGGDGRCLMRMLREALDDAQATDCGRCAACTRARFAEPLDRQLVLDAEDHLRRRPLAIHPRKQWPASRAPGPLKIPESLRLAEGRALARAGDGGWDPLVRSGRATDGRFAEELVLACAQLLGDWRPQPTPAWVTAVPSRRAPELVPDFARRLAATLDLPYRDLLSRTGDAPPQREMRNAAQQAANVADQFAVTNAPPPLPGLLVDDQCHSRWTLTTVGVKLRQAGAGPLHPLVLTLTGT